MHVFLAAYRIRTVRYAITVLILGVLVYKLEPGRLLADVREVSAGDVVAALVLTFPFLGLKSMRWYLLLRSAGIQAGVREAVVSLLGGMGLALVTPVRLGEVARVGYIPDARKWKIAGLVLLDKGFDVLTLILLSIAGAWIVLGPPVGIAFLLLSVAGLLVVYLPGPVRSALGRLGGPTFLGGKPDELWSSLDALSPGVTSGLLALTVGAFAVVLLQFGAILASWQPWSLDIVFLTFPLVVLTNVLPITIGGLGVREAAAVVLLAHYRVPGSQAAVAAFLMFAFNTGLPGLAGAFLLPALAPRRVPTTGAARPIDRM